jgi:hypothetical protein
MSIDRYICSDEWNEKLNDRFDENSRPTRSHLPDRDIDASAHLNHAPSGIPAERLPVAALLALAMTGFVCIATETLPAGLLPGIGRGLDISESLA